MADKTGNRRTIPPWKGASLALALGITLLTMLAARSAQAQTFTTPHTFSSNDGAYPEAGLVQATNGNVHGTTEDGGDNGSNGGMIFRISPSGRLGSITSSNTIACPATMNTVPNGTCYSLTVDSCPSVALAPTATVKVIKPSGTSLGVITVSSTYGSSGAYEKEFAYGAYVIQQLVAAGYTVAEFQFAGKYGWMTHSSPDGPKADVCQFGTVSQWVYQSVAQSTQPFCATGVSGSASAIAYMLDHYGFGTNRGGGLPYYSMVEIESGPVFGRIDLGCNGNTPKIFTKACNLTANPNYDNGAASLIDSSFGNSDCVQHQTSQDSAWLNGSNDAMGAVYSFPNTDVHLLFGGKDAFAAPSLAQCWIQKLETPYTVGCVKDADHLFLNVVDAAQNTVSDLTTYCVAH